MEDFELLSPVRRIPTDPVDGEPDPGIALCLSGGGYRAMLFHLGAIWRLNELAYLPRLRRVSSVSGGSITAAVLGHKWSSLDFEDGVATGFQGHVVAPIRKLAAHTLDWVAAVPGLLLPGSIGWHLARGYRRWLFGKATLQELPDPPAPLFVINATNLQSGVLWRFTKPYARDYRVGKIASPEIDLATAVAASSAFPPVLGPTRLRFKDSDYEPGTGEDLQEEPFTTRPVLADGGVYDNLGLETAWKRCQTVLISDAGGAMAPRGGSLWKLGWWRWRDWGTQTVRVLATIDNQVRALRKRQAIGGFIASPESPLHRDGTYWGIRSEIANYDASSSLECPTERTKELAKTRTRLKRLELSRQERLINWGYAICDAAMRSHVEPGLPAPTEPPYPAVGI